jgi:N-methylhydantoinase B
MAHWLDIGGVLASVTTDIYSEGLQIPICKLYRGGEVNQDVIDLIRINVRVPERAMGDLRAQVTAVKTGEKRFQELVERYGTDEVLASIDEIMDRSEVSARAAPRRSRMASTKPRASWTMTASSSASAYPSR